MIDTNTKHPIQIASREQNHNFETIYEETEIKTQDKHFYSNPMGKYENQIIDVKQNYFSDLSENAIESAEYLKQSAELSTYHCLNNPNFNNSSQETTIRRDNYKKNKNVTTEKDINGCLDNSEDAWIPREYDHLDSVEIKNKYNINSTNNPRKKGFSFILRRNLFRKDESELGNDKSILDIRRRPSKNSEDIISDIKRFLNKSIEEESLNRVDSYAELKINFENNDENYDSDDGYVDIFSDDKDFHVDEGGWVTLANENVPKNNIERVFQKIRKSCSLTESRLRV